MRHGKSSWSDASLSDLERPLKKRGIREATIVGNRLLELTGKPDLLITSPAKRARTTARIVAEQIGYPERDIMLEPRLYGAGLPEIFTILAELDLDPSSVLLFGHNPTFTTLVNTLQSSYLDNLPTCGCIGFDLEIDSWDKAEDSRATKVINIIPSQLR